MYFYALWELTDIGGNRAIETAVKQMMRKEKKSSEQSSSERKVQKCSEKTLRKEEGELRQGIPMTDENLSGFFQFLEERRRGDGTVDAYQRALHALYEYLPEEKKVSDRAILSYWQKELFSQGYAVRTVNHRISAVNSFLEYMGRRDLQLTPAALPDSDILPELTRSEYLRLLRTAKSMGKERTYFIIKTICCAGVRVQELPQITAEAVKMGSVTVIGQCGERKIHIPSVLRAELLSFASRKGIESGPLFVTRNGMPMGRTSVNDSIKRLCRDARVPEEKGNPRCLLKLHQSTYGNIQNSVAVLIEQAYDHLLEQEQASAGWNV